MMVVQCVSLLNRILAPLALDPLAFVSGIQFLVKPKTVDRKTHHCDVSHLRFPLLEPDQFKFQNGAVGVYTESVER